MTLELTQKWKSQNMSWLVNQNAVKISLEPENPSLSWGASGKFQNAPESLSLGRTILSLPRKTLIAQEKHDKVKMDIGLNIEGYW